MLTEFWVGKVTKVFSKGFKVVKRDLLWQTWCVAPESVTQDQGSLETNAFPEERAENMPMREKVYKGRDIPDALQADGTTKREGRSPLDVGVSLWSCT